MAPPFSARRPSPDLLFERRRGNIPPCVSSRWGHPRLLQLRGGKYFSKLSLPPLRGRFSFALLRCKPPSPIRETGQDHCHTGPWSHQEESNLQPTDYKTVALPVELRWHMCAVPLRLSHPSLGGDIMISHSQGSFQRDSAGAGHSCHRFRLHDRRASCPFSGAVRRSRLPGIVSFHSQPRVL